MLTQTMGAFEAKTHFSKILEVVEAGEQVIITKHGHPVARIVPFKEKEDRKQAGDIITQLEEFNRAHTLGNVDWKTLRDEGRK